MKHSTSALIPYDFIKVLILFGLIVTTGLPSHMLRAQAPVTRVIGQEVKALHISANLVVNTADELLSYVDRAQAKGANAVFYSDSKLNTFGLEGTAGNRWDAEMRKFVDGVKSRNMKLHLMTIVIGFSGTLLATNPDLTTGYPIRDQLLRAVGNKLRPVSSASVINGGFESYADNQPTDWGFQDAAGERIFIDTQVKHSGNVSLRAEARDGAMSRIFTALPVRKFHQYTLSLWIKTEDLTADNLLLLVRDENNKDRNLTNLRLSTPREGGGRDYFNRPRDLTLDWTEVRIAFNSLDATEVSIGLTVFGGQNGTVWWDDVSISDTPTLNWLNRNDLPRSVVRDDGTPLAFGQDVELPVDEQLGQSRFLGSYDTQHAPPAVKIASNARIQEGDIVTISGYHGLPTANGQVSASWNNPETYQRMRTIHQTLQDTFEPDGYLLNYSEIRTGGWEPLDEQYETSGQALAASIKQAYQDLAGVAPNVEHFFWSDMVDPEHNAKANYYQVNNTLDQSWTTLDPKKVTIATWWEGQKITDQGPSSLSFFSDLGFKQIVGAYYDADVTDNYNRWQAAAEGVDGVVGSIFATWTKNYTNLEAFGDLWWSSGSASSDFPALAGRYWRLDNKAVRQWIRSQGCATAYDETIPLVVTSTNNTGNCTMFEFIPTDDGYYFIQNRATSGRYRPKDCSTVANDAIEIVQVGSNSDGWCEQWKLVDAGEGYYRIQNRQTGHWIRSQGCSGETNESVPITQVSQNYTGNCTRWKLVDVDTNTNSDMTVSTESFLLYPNPADQQVDLRTTKTDATAKDIYRILIYDTQGIVAKQFDGEYLMDHTLLLDVSDVREGVYTLSIEYAQGTPQRSPLIIRH